MRIAIRPEATSIIPSSSAGTGPSVPVVASPPLGAPWVVGVAVAGPPPEAPGVVGVVAGVVTVNTTGAEAGPTLPTASVAVAVTVWSPSASGVVGVIDQEPS